MESLLLAISGMSPAVITETLYGIDRRDEPWPKGIRIITTSKGRERLWQGLVEQAYLTALCTELGRPTLALAREHILVVTDAAGNPVADARSVADHEALADFIMTVVRDLTRDDTRRIHASIAGGRKTMTFYLGYAMSLFGRHFDCMSHVLVSEDFENRPDFYFPTREPQSIRLVDGRELHTHEAEVTLADIPFIRQRDLLPKMLKDVGDNVNFRQLVDLINLGDQPENVRVTVHATLQRLVLKSVATHELAVTVELPNLWHWIFYLLIIEDSRKDIEERGGYIRPSTKQPDASLALEMALRLAALSGVEIDGENFTELTDALLDIAWLNDRHPMLERSLRAVSDKQGVTDSHVSTYINAIQHALSLVLPDNLVQCLVPTQVYDIHGRRLDNVGRIKNKGGAYGVPLPDPVGQIKIL